MKIGWWTASLLMLAYSPAARAGLAMTVSPALLEFEVPPGQSASQSVHVVNRGEQPLVLTSEIWEWKVTATGEQMPARPTVGSTLPSWFTITPPSLTLGPGKIGNLNVTVSLPKEVSAGQYALVYIAGHTDTGQGDRVGVGGEIPVRILINTGTVEPHLNLSIIEVRPSTEHEQLQVTLLIENVGAVHAWAEPSVDIVGPMDDFVGALVPEDRFRRVLLLPGEKQRVPMGWGGALPPATYDVVAAAYFGREGVAMAQTSLIVPEPAAEPKPRP